MKPIGGELNRCLEVLKHPTEKKTASKSKSSYRAPDQVATDKSAETRKLNLIPRPDKLKARMTRQVLEGPILKENICLKLDRFPSISGDLPAWRKIGGIYGCAQPTLKGIEMALKETGGQEGRTIEWTNLRAEPVLYIKGQPYSPKDKNSTENNFEYPEMTPKQIAEMEARLKKEVLNKLKKGEKLDFCFPQAAGGYCLTELPAGEIKTMSEVYQELGKKYPMLDFKRIAINDRKRPDDKDFDALVDRFKDRSPETSYVTNCMGGWGRTTTAMTVFDIMRTVEQDPDADFTRVPALRQEIKEEGKGNFGALKTMLSAGKLAEFTVNQFIVKQDEKDFQAIIDNQGKAGCHMLREVSWGARNNPKRTKDFLDRYLYLAAFFQYCKEEAPRNYQTSFSLWIKPRQRKLEVSSQVLEKLFKLEGKFAGN